MFCECGTGSFKHVDEDSEDDLVGCTGGGSPRGGKERRTKQHGGKVNPYAGRGLDRFSVVLSELETRRAKILRRVAGGSVDTGLVLVRFVQSKNGDWTPVVVKLPEQPPPSSKKATAAAKKPARAVAAASTAATLRRPAPPAASSPPRSPPPDPASITSATTAKVVAATSSKTKAVPARKASFSLGRRMRRPSYYWPSVIVLTLVSLAVFGRVFAICLASIWWYVLPTLGSAGGCVDDGAGEAVRRGPAGMMRMSMEKKKVPPPPHTKPKKASSSGVYEVVRSPKGKRG